MPAQCEGKLPWNENRDKPLENGKHPYGTGNSLIK